MHHRENYSSPARPTGARTLAFYKINISPIFEFFAPKCFFFIWLFKKLLFLSEADQGAYSCEAINSQGSCFAGSAGCGQPGQVSQLSLLKMMTLLNYKHKMLIAILK